MKKIDWISNTRVFATTGIILLHVAAIVVVNEFSTTPNLYWWVGNIYDSFVRCGTPLFFMITGALFLSKEIEIISFLKKRFIRIMIPFLFWSLIYIVNEATLSSVYQKTNFFTNIWNAHFGARLLKGEISYHLWYVYSVIGLYLFIPILNKWIKNSTEKEILYFLIVWVITLILSYRYFEGKISWYLKPLYFAEYIGYLVLGYYLFKINVSEIMGGCLTKFDRKRFYGTLIVLSFLITALGTYFFSIKEGKFSHIFYDRLSINVLFLAIGVFLFIKSCNLTNKIFIKTINFLFKYSYGIFLVHALVLPRLHGFGINAYFIHPLLGIPITTLACLGISTLIVFLVNKLPFVGKYISG